MEEPGDHRSYEVALLGCPLLLEGVGPHHTAVVDADEEPRFESDADAQSVLNQQGMFGSAVSEFSLMNPGTRFTRADSDQSVTNPGATRPPNNPARAAPSTT